MRWVMEQCGHRQHRTCACGVLSRPWPRASPQPPDLSMRWRVLCAPLDSALEAQLTPKAPPSLSSNTPCLSTVDPSTGQITLALA